MIQTPYVVGDNTIDVLSSLTKITQEPNESKS